MNMRACCWFYKSVIRRCTDAGEPIPERTQRHVRDCPVCGEFYKVERALTRGLLAGAEFHRHSPSPFLRPRIMRSLERRSRVNEPVRKSLHPIWAAGLIVSLGVLCIFLTRTSQSSNSPSSPGSSAGSRLMGRQLGNLVSRNSGQTVFEWSKAIDQPLESEMQLVVNDAKAAIWLLAQNFLPEKAPTLPP